MVNTVLQGVKALQNLSRLRPNLLSMRTESSTKFVERTGQFAAVFEVDRFGSEFGRAWKL